MSKAKESALPTHLTVRHARVREALIKARLDAILLTSPADLGYVTGVPWEDCWLLLTHDDLTVVTDSRYDEELGQRNPWLRRIIFKGKQTLADAFADLLMKSRVKRVGLEQNFITHGAVRLLQQKLKDRTKRGPAPKLVPVSNLTVNVRKVKDAEEIGTLRRAVACAEDAYRVVRADLRVGMTESEVAARLEYEMRRRGAAKGSFETNVSAGANSSLPHYRPRDAKLSADSALLFDWGANVDGYCSDLTRSHAIGRPPAKFREIFQVVLAAQRAAIEAIRPGVTTRAVDAAARKLIARAGYGKNFGHGLGHGIGLAVHELPRLSRVAAPEPLMPGMVVTVEPGVYLPGFGGVRIEDDVLVTESGCEVLSSLDKTYEGCHLE